MFLLIVERRWNELLDLGRTLRFEDRSLALFAFDYAITFLFSEGPLETAVLQQMTADFTIFPMFSAYAALIKSQCNEARASQVFGINKGESDSYVLSRGTLLYESAHVEKGRDILVIPGPDGFTITRSALLRLLRRTLDDRLHSRFCDACKKAQILRPCVSYRLSAGCVDTPSCRWTHQQGLDFLDEQGIHLRIRFLCEVIAAYGMYPNVKMNSGWEARCVFSKHMPSS